MTYQEALKKANAFISNELTNARPALDKPSTFSIFIGKDGLTISILDEEEEDCDAETGSD